MRFYDNLWKWHLLRAAVLLAVLFGCGALRAGVIDSDSVRLRVRAVTEWQLDNRDANALALQSWQLASFHAAAVRAAAVTGDPGYYEAMRQVGELAQWQPGALTYHADYHAIGMMYFDLSRHCSEAAFTAAMIDRLDFILANPSTQGVNDRYNSGNPAVTGQVMRWWWCDALFMAPPVWMDAYLQSGDSVYRDFMVQEWQATDGLLYSTTHDLFYRDTTFLGSVGADGYPVFWGRGNGWAFAAFAEVLKRMPQSDPARPWFVARFQSMAAALLAAQHAAGWWGMDLLNPSVNTHGEASATAFFCYGFLYGVNAGLLDASIYLPAAEAAWEALRGYITADGELTHVQPPGAGPQPFTLSNSEAYGAGAFILAGSELYHLKFAAEREFDALSVTNTAAVLTEMAVHSPLAQLAVYAPGQTRTLQVRCAETGTVVPSVLLDGDGDGIDDTLYFRDTFLESQVKEYRIFADIQQSWTPSLEKNLLFWWKLDDTNTLSYADSTCSGADLVPSGAVVPASGRIGGAAELTSAYGSASRLQTGSITNTFSYYTVAGWIYPRVSYANQFPRVLECDLFTVLLRDTATHVQALGMVAKTTTGGTYREWVVLENDSASSITHGQWHHVAVAYDPTRPMLAPEMYINGVKKSVGQLTANAGTVQTGSVNPFYLGNNAAANRSFPGRFDDMRVYDRALSPEEIRELYRLNAPGAPVVNAGVDRVVYGSGATLVGTLTDNGAHPSQRSAAFAWSVVAAPAGAEAVIADPNRSATEVALPLPGTYEFLLTADNGFATGSDSVVIEAATAAAQPGNLPPLITLVTNAYAVILPCGVALQVTAVDPDSVPASNLCSAVWSKTAGPGEVRFESSDTAATVAWFSSPGSYTLTVEASDGQDIATASVTVAVADGTPMLRWYTMDAVNSAIIYDSARGADATVNKPNFVVGRIGNAFASLYPAAIEFEMPYAEALTMTAWVYHYATHVTDWPKLLSVSGDYELNWNVMFVGNENAITLNVRQENNVEMEYKTPTDSFRKEEWMHLAVVHDRRGFNLPVFYINGVRQSIAAQSGKVGNANYAFLPYGRTGMIGNRDDLQRRFNGMIDDYRIYGAVLSSNEIVQVMNEEVRPAYAVYPAGNLPPEVQMGDTAEASLGKPLDLAAVIGDDGIPLGVTNCRWRKLSGAGAVTFSDPTAAESEAVFTQSGVYVLELSVSDGEKTTVRNVHVTVINYSGTVILLR